MNKVLLFNPRSANYKARIPNSILAAAASLEGLFDYVIVDGNLESDPGEKIFQYLSSGDFKYFGLTSMPGPQLKQAIPISKKVREIYPHINLGWVFSIQSVKSGFGVRIYRFRDQWPG